MDFNEEISNTRLATKFKKYLRQSGQFDKLPNIFYCGSQVIKQKGSLPAVFLLSNEKDEKAKFFGTTSCHSAWACPKCTAKVMAQKGGNIACAIDALAKWKQQYAFMVTFTLPHTKSMSAKETFDILQKSWRDFCKGYSTDRVYKYKRNVNQEKNAHNPHCTEKEYVTIKTSGTSFKNSFGRMHAQLGIKYFVKVYEFTWSDNNSWHPHIHALLWTHKDNWNKILSYQNDIFELWWKVCKKNTAKVCGKELAEELYTDWRKEPVTGHRSLFISVDKKGKVVKQSSSMYICGWNGYDEKNSSDAQGELKNGNVELTALNYKKASEGHYTPNQLLEQAELDPEHAEKWFKLYAEYAIATFKHRRVQFAERTDIYELIRKWKLTNEYTEIFKKKVMGKEKEHWRVVYWFSEKQWKLICWLNLTTENPVLTEILTRAPDKQKLEEYLDSLGIPLTTREHPDAKFVEHAVFENRIYDPELKAFLDQETGELFDIA